jgi:hypothetical protein
MGVKIQFTILIAAALLVSGCSASSSRGSFESRLLDASDPSKGMLIWDDPVWKLQCPNPSDFGYIQAFQEPITDEGLPQEKAKYYQDTCAQLAYSLTTPDEFTEATLNAEIDAYIKYSPLRAECVPFIKFRMTKEAVSTILKTKESLDAVGEIVSDNPEKTGALWAKLSTISDLREAERAYWGVKSILSGYTEAVEKLYSSDKSLIKRCDFEKSELDLSEYRW